MGEERERPKTGSSWSPWAPSRARFGSYPKLIPRSATRRSTHPGAASLARPDLPPRHHPDPTAVVLSSRVIVRVPAFRTPRARFPRGPRGRARRCGDKGGATKHRGGQTRATDVAGEDAGIRGAIHPGSAHVSVIFPVRRRLGRRFLEHPRQLGLVPGARSVSDGLSVATMASPWLDRPMWRTIGRTADGGKG